MHIWQQIWQFILNFWEEARRVIPLSEEEKRLRVQFLQRLLMVIIPMLIILLIVRGLYVSDTTLRTYLIIGGGMATASMIYLITYYFKYEVIIGATFILACIMIFLNSATSDQPYYAITYLLLLPIIAVMLLSLRETLIWLVSTYVTFLVFGIFVIAPISLMMFFDLAQMLLIFNLFIVVMGFQRNKLERERQGFAVEKERSEVLQFLMTSISHDFKTPLSIINSSVYLIRRSLDDDAQTDRLDKIIQQTTHLDNMIQDIVTLSQLEYKDSESLSPLDLKQILNQTITNLQAAIHAKNLNLEADLAENPSKVLGTYEGLRRISYNLLQNAITYTPDGGNIRISLTQNNEHLNLYIADDGIGIANVDMNQVFRPFFRVDIARSTQGSGLGLALVKKTVEMYGGSIRIESKIDEGTRVIVTFPLNATNVIN